MFNIKVTSFLNISISTEYMEGKKADPHEDLNSKSVSTNLIVIIIGFIITLALLI